LVTCWISSLVVGPIPSAVMIGCPPKKFSQPESTTRKMERPASRAACSARSSWSRLRACRHTFVPGDCGKSLWYSASRTSSWHRRKAPRNACPAWDASLPGVIPRSARTTAYSRSVGSDEETCVCGGDAEQRFADEDELEADASINCEGLTETYVCLFILAETNTTFCPPGKFFLESAPGGI
jgi:hypothetical protein